MAIDLNDPELLERLADLEHVQWIAWTEYMLDALVPVLNITDDDSLPMLRYRGWRRQIATAYADLSDREKESDREWAHKIIALIQAHAADVDAQEAA